MYKFVSVMDVTGFVNWGHTSQEANFVEEVEDSPDFWSWTGPLTVHYRTVTASMSQSGPCLLGCQYLVSSPILENNGQSVILKIMDSPLFSRIGLDTKC